MSESNLMNCVKNCKNKFCTNRQSKSVSIYIYIAIHNIKLLMNMSDIHSSHRLNFIRRNSYKYF